MKNYEFTDEQLVIMFEHILNLRNYNHYKEKDTGHGIPKEFLDKAIKENSFNLLQIIEEIASEANYEHN